MSGIRNSDPNGPVEMVVLVNPSNRALYDKTLLRVRANYMQMYTNKQYLGSDQETLLKILDSDDLNVENEEVVFDSVRQWSIYNHIHSENIIDSLMKVVRLSLLPIKYLFDEVEPFIYPFKDSRDAFLNELRNRNISGKKSMVRKYQKISLEKYVITTIPDSATSSTKLLSIGSNRLDSANIVEIYDGNLNQWIKPNNLSISRRNYAVALVEDRVMLVGGTRSHQEDTEPLNIVQSLDLTTGSLLTEAPLNEPRQYAATVGFNKGKMSFVYVFGGRGNNDDLDSVERWDASSRVWTYMKQMPSKRTGLAAAILKEKIYILGGRIGNNYTNTMEAYCQEHEKWEVKAPMKLARAHFCVAVMKGYMYAVAGSKGFNLPINAVEIYDPSNDSWTTIANIMATGHVGISSLGNRLISAGRIYSNSVLEYNSKSNKWLELEDMPVPRSGFLIKLPPTMNDLKFDWNDRKLLMIGNQESGKAYSLEVFDSRNNQWTQLKDLNIGSSINYSVACAGNALLMIEGDSSTVIKINLRTGNVSNSGSLNNHRQQSAVVTVNQGTLTFVYVIGGMRDELISNSVERRESFSRNWTTMTPMSFARTGHGAVLLQNKIYVVGGKTETGAYDKSVEAYDFENDRWTSKAPMNNPNAYFGIATFKNAIFVVGGNRDSTTQVNNVERYDPEQNIWTTIANISSKGAVGISSMGDRLICAGGKSSNIVQEYDENSKQWRTLNPLRNKCTGVLVELQSGMEIYSGDWVGLDKLIFLGGWTASQVQNIEIFDVLREKWTQLKNLPLARPNCNVNLIFNKLLIIGGQKDKYQNEVDAIDLSSGTIQSLPPLIQGRYDPSSAVVMYEGKQTLYVIGGYAEKFLSSVEKWDPLTNKWTEVVSMPTARYGLGCVFLNDTIYAVGGDNGSPLNIVEAFSIKNNKWETKAPMNHARGFFGIAIFENQIYVAGGYPKIKTVERYDPLKNTWTTLADIQSSWQVGLCALGDRLICAGGDENNVEEYDSKRNRWIALPPKIMAPQKGYLMRLPANAILENW